MDRDRWRRVEEALSQALDAPAEHRAEVVARACGGDHELRAEVESLLASEDRADAVLGRLRAAVADGVHHLEPDAAHTPEPPALGPGERLGAYELERLIGRGGMGVVYLGHRADRAYEGRVAIKVLARADAGEDLPRRFHQERQILANLDHPHVARLLDAGTSPDGAPYFVMEHVEGTAIDAWCDRRRLPVADRIRLFQKVLDAVQAAHRGLVVHRDLKPANIRVTPDGAPKLLDFGIAKLLDARGFPHAAETTRTSLRPMTLSHASPEQITGGPITTATDVYGLGVTLYRLLTGRLPYREDAPLHDAIVHDDPIAASAAVTPEAAADRGLGAPQLRSALAGDLDVILQTALAKEPSRRYGSAEAFAADLERHLLGLPVSARRPTLAYRAAKFVRRNRVAAGLGTVLAASVLAFTVSMGLLAERLARERDRAEAARMEAEAERDRARQEELEAQQVVALLVDLFSQPDPARTRGEPVTAREVLDRGVERVDRELQDQPRVQAELLATIGRAYHGLGLYEAAAPLLERVVELRGHVLGADHPETLDSLYHAAAALYELGEFDRSLRLYRQTLEGQLRELGRDAPRVADTLERLAVLEHRFLNDFAAAEESLDRALAIRRSRPDDEEGLARTLQGLAILEGERGRYRNAEPLYREAYAIRRRVLGEDHPQTLASFKGVANAVRVQGRYEESEAIARRLLEIERRVLGEDHERIAFTLSYLGFSVLYQGRAEEAERHFREALRIRRKVLGEDHLAVKVTLTNLGAVLRDQGRLDEAEALYRSALEAGEQGFPEHSHMVAYPLIALGEVLTARGATEEAEPLLRQALRLRRSTLGPENPRTAQAESALAECLTARGAVAEAEELLVHAWSVQEGNRIEHGYYRELTRSRLEELYRRLGRHVPEELAPDEPAQLEPGEPSAARGGTGRDGEGRLSSPASGPG